MALTRAGRWGSAFLLCAGLLLAQKPPKPQEPPEPPEEDETLAVQEYTFNPLQAEKELQVGKFYFKKGSYRAAAQRFAEAGKWNPGLAETYLRLAEAREKLRDIPAARAAYARYVEVETDPVKVKDARARLARLPADKPK